MINGILMGVGFMFGLAAGVGAMAAGLGTWILVRRVRRHG